MSFEVGIPLNASGPGVLHYFGLQFNSGDRSLAGIGELADLDVFEEVLDLLVRLVCEQDPNLALDEISH